MSLADRLESGPPARGKRCAICILRANLPDVEAEALDAMLDDPRWSDAQTWEALKDEGHLLHLSSDQTLGQHRRRCMKDAA